IVQLHEFFLAHRDDHVSPDSKMVEAARIAPELLLSLTTFFAAETKAQQDKVESQEKMLARLNYTLIASLLVGLGGALWAAIVFTRGIARRIRWLETAAANLESGVPRDAISSSNDEIGRLATAMEKAGAILANHGHELKIALENAQCLIWDLDTVS